MDEHADQPRLTERFADALGYTARLHRTQTRKASDIPYVGHLLSVAGLVIEAGGDETQVIGALLHDAAEDRGGRTTLEEIRTRFGDDVARIVEECSDTLQTPKPPWRPRKEAHIDRLAGVSQPTILVSLADKLDNVRAILRDLRLIGPRVWRRFSVHDPAEHLWYYRSLLSAYRDRSDSWLVDALDRVLTELSSEITGGP